MRLLHPAAVRHTSKQLKELGITTIESMIVLSLSGIVLL